MKKSLTLFMFMLACMFSYAQSSSINLFFTGRMSTNQYVQLHHVEITNVTRNWTETINYPDTLLTILYSIDHTGVNDYAAAGGPVIFPNPFNGQTIVDIQSDKNEMATIQIFDINGKMYANRSKELQSGSNTFEINLATPQVYFLNIVSARGTQSIKMINSGNGNGNSIIPVAQVAPNVTLRQVTNRPFQPGDIMRYVGYYVLDGEYVASQPIERAQNAEYGYEDFTLIFDAILYTVNFEANGGVGTMEPQSFTAGISQQLNTNTFTRENYFFSGWNTQADGEGTYYNNQQNIMISSNMTLYAQWLENADDGGLTCPVSYIRNNEDGANGEISAVRDHQNNSYSLVFIGNQCWTRENMRCSTSRSSNSNLVVSSGVSNDVAHAYIPHNQNFGLLYNFTAANDICPTGWHLPTAADFDQMLAAAQASNAAVRIVDGNLWTEDTTNINYPGHLTSPYRNHSHFSALPAGYYSYLDFYGGENLFAYFWTDELYPQGNSYAYFREISHNSNFVRRSTLYKSCGLSVRCVRD